MSIETFMYKARSAAILAIAFFATVLVCSILISWIVVTWKWAFA